MVANAIANEFQKKFDSQPGNDSVAFISVKGSDILGSLQGQSESRIEAVFQEARNKAGEEGYAILFFDEIETLIPDRNAPDTDGTDSRLTVAFLQEMNNIGDNVMVVGATNLPFSIDSAASRRFKTKLFVRHPDSDALAELWRESLNDIDTDLNNQDFDELGEMSEAFTPSEIDAFLQSEVQSDIVEGMLNNDPVDLDMEYFESKINDMQPRVVEEYISSVDQPDMFSQDQMQGYRELESYIENNRSIVDGNS
jgi:transitional endoplasmic reticulum ATPase